MQENKKDIYNELPLEPDRLNANPVLSPKHKKKLTKKRKIWIGIAVAILLVFFTPWRINVLLLGIDGTPSGTAQGRSDTMILVSDPPLLPYFHTLSIPRDLLVDVPGHGQDRINTAHFFAEIEKTGSGPKAAAEVVALNFGVSEPYTVRIQFEGFKKIVKAMGGVDVILPRDMSGMDAGVHHLTATESLAFVRDRYGSDDFFRQERGQLFLKAAFRKMINPANWWRIPRLVSAVNDAIDSNVPFFYWPRLAYSLLFSAARGVDMHIFERNVMATPWITDGGGHVLLPNWDAINPLIEKYFK